jgi:D-galactarolactone isomerase
MVALGSGGAPISSGVSQARQVPSSSGAEQAGLKAPAGACDGHHHIYDAVRFAPVQPGGTFIPNARVEEYQMLQRRIGTSHEIVVMPLACVTDNRVTFIEAGERDGLTRALGEHPKPARRDHLKTGQA